MRPDRSAADTQRLPARGEMPVVRLGGQAPDGCSVRGDHIEIAFVGRRLRGRSRRRSPGRPATKQGRRPFRGPRVSRTASVPTARISQISELRVNRICLPSGDQSGEPPAASRWGRVPSAFITQTAEPLAAARGARAKTIRFPFGDQLGCSSASGLRVSRRTAVPFALLV
jgi:hypothetical protein